MNSATKSIVAVGCGCLVFIAASVTTGLAWGRYSEGRYPNAIMIASMLGAIVAGYVAGLAAGRAQLGHALCVWGVIIAWSLVVRFIELHEHTAKDNWPHWVVGVINVMTWFVAGGLLRYWQVVRRRERAYPGAAPNGGPATPVANSGVTEGPPSVS